MAVNFIARPTTSRRPDRRMRIDREPVGAPIRDHAIEGITMTRYAIHDIRTELICCWGVGYGDTAAIVAVLPASASRFERSVLAESLTRLSRALWRCYTHPASAMVSTEPNTEGWRRQET